MWPVPSPRSLRGGRALALGAIGLLLALPVIAQESSLVSSDLLPPVISRPYEVQVGDVLEIAFFKTTDLSQERTVGPDGDIYLTLVGRVTVVHRTIDDITRELTERYGQEMVNPQITVSVKEFSGLQVYVGGEVLDPGIQTYQGKLTLVQAIMAAGGFTTRARRKEVLLIRRGADDQPVGTIVDVKDIIRKGGLSHDVPLAPLDTIYVHYKKIVNVNLFVEQYISANIPRLGDWFYWTGIYQANTRGN